VAISRPTAQVRHARWPSPGSPMSKVVVGVGGGTVPVAEQTAVR
jgi:hypothetical protein